jgi:hypothetical protein
VEIWGKLYAVEALANGNNINPIEDYVKYNNKDLLVRTPRKPYSKTEKELMNTTASKAAFKPTRYDYLGIIYQIDMIKRTKNSMNKKWAGPTGDKATDRLYCSEACANWANIVRPGTFDKPWAVNPLDIDLNKYYINKDIN